MPLPTSLAGAAALFVDKDVNPFVRELPTLSDLPDIDISFGSSGAASQSASTRDEKLDALVIGDSQAGGPLGRAIVSRLSSMGYAVAGPRYDNGARGAAVADMVPDASSIPDLVVAIFGGNDASTSDAVAAADSIYDQVVPNGGYLIIVGPSPVTTIKDSAHAGKVFKSSIGPNPAPDTWFLYDAGRYAQRRVDIAVALESAMAGKQNVSVYGIAARQAPPQGPGTGSEYPDQPDGVHVGPAYASDLAQEILDAVGISEITKTIKDRLSAGSTTQGSTRALGPGDLASGITASSGVNWSTAAIDFLNRMRAKLDPSVKLHVTSVTRDEKSQAAAMLKKWQLGGDREIEKVYRDNARYFLDAPKNVDSWAAVVSDLRAKGIAFQRGHLTGTAVDIRTNNLTSAEVQLLVAAAEDAGGDTLLEDNPPHLHVGGLDSAPEVESEYSAASQQDYGSFFAGGSTPVTDRVSQSSRIDLSNDQIEMMRVIEQVLQSERFTQAGIAAAFANAWQESRFDPKAEGDSGHSIGLFQLHDEGVGKGMSVEERQDPIINTRKIASSARESKFWDWMSSTDDPQILASAFSKYVERPRDKLGNMRDRAETVRDMLGLEDVESPGVMSV